MLHTPTVVHASLHRYGCFGTLEPQCSRFAEGLMARQWHEEHHALKPGGVARDRRTTVQKQPGTLIWLCSSSSFLPWTPSGRCTNKAGRCGYCFPGAAIVPSVIALAGYSI